MSQSELLKLVTSSLTDMNIDYMLTGSIVSSLQGEPRSTHDIDIIITIRPTDVPKLLNIFSSPRFYLDEDSILDAIKNKSMFNLLDSEEGDKVDFWILTHEPFDQSRFERRITESFLGMPLVISRPEDTILAKLLWSKKSGGSVKQFTDALRIYEVQYPNLDICYTDGWAKKLDLLDLWNELKSSAQCID